MSHDEISNPKHYDLFPGMQAIDVIEASLTPAEFAGYLKGNALKYRLRAGNKGPAETCIAKADRYRDRLFEVSKRHEFVEELFAVADGQQYTGPGGVMIHCPGCDPKTCGCRP